MIAWCGSLADGLGWLSERCGVIEALEIVESLSIESVDEICGQHPRRLILSVENRLSYPALEILHLQRSWPEVPFALAVGSWFDGSRRTGVGSTSHLTLPWYRWWDGWQYWLCGTNTELLNPWPQRALQRTGHETNSFGQSGVVLSNCRQNAMGLQAGLGCDSKSVRWQTLQEFHRSLEQPLETEPEFILWDDSCLDTFLGADGISKVSTLFNSIRERLPSATILAATCMPRWSDWQQWMEAGAHELLAKPSQGVSLNDILQGRSKKSGIELSL